MRLVSIGLGMVNTTVGAFSANVERAVRQAQEMSQARVTVACFPEQLVGGYPQEDLVQWASFVERQWEGLQQYARRTAALPLVSVLGVTVAHQSQRYNCAAVVAGGRVHGLVPKEKLPTYNVFYEGRTFARGRPGLRAEVEGVPLGDFLFRCDFGLLGVEVCEDLWSADGPLRRRAYSGAELYVNVSASPYRLGAQATRRELLSTRAADHQCTLAYVNRVGAQDGLIFDGGGFINQSGRMALEAPRFREAWAAATVDLERSGRLRAENSTWRDDQRAWALESPAVPVLTVDVPTRREGLTYPVPEGRSFFLPAPAGPPTAPRAAFCEELLEALALGVGDYVEKNGFRGLGIALSGGRDSLLTLLIAHRYASRAGKPLEAFYMPSRFSSAETWAAAQAICEELQVPFTVVSIEEAFEREVKAAQELLGPERPLTPITLQNIQARIRAQRMWNWANTSGGLFLQTGNMSEKAVGYTTIGGDLMGGLAVISNVPKTVVTYLLDYLHELHGYRGIALALRQPAGPELAAGQTGEGELMPFPVLDACFHLFAGEKLSPDEVLRVVGQLFPEVAPEVRAQHVARFVKLFTGSIYKWVQSPVSLHIGNLDLDRERALQLPVVTRIEWKPGQP